MRDVLQCSFKGTILPVRETLFLSGSGLFIDPSYFLFFLRVKARLSGNKYFIVMVASINEFHLLATFSTLVLIQMLFPKIHVPVRVI